MSVLKVVEWPAKVLETKSEEVKEFDEDLKKFVADMHETMDEAGGIGLAANQVNVAKRILTICIPWTENKYAEQEEKKEHWHDKRWTFVNPVITKKKGKFRWQEGCLSFPEVFEFVDRAEEIWVTAQDENGETFEVHANGLFAVCLQHEIDHIDGIVFINRMSRLKSTMVRKKVLKRQRLMNTEVEE
ncbi:peptide deformylase [Pseudobacteriovorax antillogorgiicola]|uniref:Peptide deformylase n=1 Tax=Pseudobacteriovorax antillogorgiicola TaxID=1513793 RepID=A0A1Y6B8C9_9BACT|nr:peptide deformylase [Pseudobacteriovorax antillogorgiicola]TCS59291.1 peptide deformylase [Pseudobacteriovorax antillogorgiicola]SME89694.1 peptide deformylase [Pseudobacteriovorax antillogorgiicola]